MVPSSRQHSKFIEDQKSRRLTFHRRSMGLKKKSSELSTLCAIDVAILMKEDHNGETLFWPPEVEKVKSIFGRCKQEGTTTKNSDDAEATWTDQLRSLPLKDLKQLLCNIDCLQYKLEFKRAEINLLDDENPAVQRMERPLFEDEYLMLKRFEMELLEDDEAIGESGSNISSNVADSSLNSEVQRMERILEGILYGDENASMIVDHDTKSDESFGGDFSFYCSELPI